MNMYTQAILVVDDHDIVREGVRSLLTTARPSWTVSEAAGGAEAIASIRKNPPDLVVMDITMPDASGFDVTSQLRKSGFDRPILVLTMHESRRLSDDVRQAGGQGYVLKSEATDHLVRAIDILLGGGTFFGKKPEPEPTRGGPNPAIIFFGDRGFNPDPA